MKKANHILVVGLALTLGLSSSAWGQRPRGGAGPMGPRPMPQSGGARNAPAPGMPQNVVPDRPPQQRQDQERRRGQGDGKPQRMGPQTGDWLRQFKDVPPEQQERALASDAHFQKLSPERQQQLRERLRQFNNLTPEMKERLLNRMAKFDSFTPEQRERLRSFQERFKQLPDERKKALRYAFRQLRDMTPEERQRTLGAERFRNMFSDSERDILKGLAEFEPEKPAGDNPPPPELLPNFVD